MSVNPNRVPWRPSEDVLFCDLDDFDLEPCRFRSSERLRTWHRTAIQAANAAIATALVRFRTEEPST